MLTASIIFRLIESIVVLGLIIFFIGLMISLIGLDVPFFPTSRKIQDVIAKAMNVSPTDIVYDLGSGDGRILATCFRSQPSARYIGIEIHFLPYILSWIQWWRLGRPKNIEFRKDNIFTADFSDATNVFIYLIPAVLEKLWPKLQKELKPGTRLVSCDFRLRHKKPEKIIDIPDSVGKRIYGRKLYVYIF